MRKLVATFTVTLPSRFLVHRPVSDELHYAVKMGDFDVELTLMKEFGWRVEYADKQEATFGIDAVQISVARDETIEPPPPLETGSSVVAMMGYSQYYEERLPSYQATAVETLNRVIRFEVIQTFG